MMQLKKPKSWLRKRNFEAGFGNFGAGTGNTTSTSIGLGSRSRRWQSLVEWNVEREIASLAQNLDNAIKVCAEMTLITALGRTDKGKRQNRAEELGILSFSSDKDSQPHPKFGHRRSGIWLDYHASVSFTKYAQPVCRIMVSNSDWAKETRHKTYDLLEVGNFYTSSEEEVLKPDGTIEKVYTADLGPDRPITPIVRITTPTDDVKTNLQLAITVAMVTKGNN